MKSDLNLARFAKRAFWWNCHGMFIAHEFHKYGCFAKRPQRNYRAQPKMSRRDSTPVAVNKLHVLWRSAFQAHRALRAYPGTSYPVTIATLCSAFQARTLNVYERLCLPSTNVRFQQTIYRQVVRLSYKHLFLRPRWEARFEPYYPQDNFHYPQDNFHYPQDNFHYPQDNFHYPQDNFSAHIR